MTEERAEAVAHRLGQVRSLEAGFQASLVRQLPVLRANPRAFAVAERLLGLVRQHQAAIEAQIGPHEPGIPEAPAVASAPSASTALESLARSATDVVIAYGSLSTTARLMYRPEVCDLAEAHAAAWMETLAELNDALPDVLAADLRRQDLVCRCVCPACGIGACGCVRRSIEVMRETWGRPGLAPEHGWKLFVPPRPGSQLAEAGLDRGDRILAVDGEAVHATPDLQRGLRGHEIGDPATLRVLRGGETIDLRVARVSDFP
jgi:membrane-associated protease RseP (regulator of RpoE activity)